MTALTLPEPCTPDYIREFVQSNPSISSRCSLVYVKLILRELGLEPVPENWKPIREFVRTYMNELSGIYIVVVSDKIVGDATYEGIEAAKVAARNTPNSQIVLVKAGWLEYNEQAAVRLLRLFPDDPWLVRELVKVLVSFDPYPRSSLYANIVLSRARARLAVMW